MKTNIYCIPEELSNIREMLNDIFGELKVGQKQKPRKPRDEQPKGEQQNMSLKQDTSLKVFQKQEVGFVKTKEGKTLIVKPVVPNKNYPVKCFFNLETLSTVLLFSDQTRVRVTVDTHEEGFSPEGKNAMTGIIIALARRILGKRASLVQFYDKFKSTEATEAFFYGIVMEYFISSGIVKSSEHFDMWLADYVATNVNTVQRNPRPCKDKFMPESDPETEQAMREAEREILLAYEEKTKTE